MPKGFNKIRGQFSSVNEKFLERNVKTVMASFSISFRIDQGPSCMIHRIIALNRRPFVPRMFQSKLRVLEVASGRVDLVIDESFPLGEWDDLAATQAFPEFLSHASSCPRGQFPP